MVDYYEAPIPYLQSPDGVEPEVRKCHLWVVFGGEEIDFGEGEGAAVAGGEPGVQQEGADAFAVEAEDLIAAGVEHALHLVIAAFMDAEEGFMGCEDFQPGGPGGEIFVGKVDASGKSVRRFRGDGIAGGDAVGFGNFVIRLGDVARPSAVVCEEK